MDANERIGLDEAAWCVDSETGEQLLIHYKTGEILARKDREGNIIHGKGN